MGVSAAGFLAGSLKRTLFVGAALRAVADEEVMKLHGCGYVILSVSWSVSTLVANSTLMISL